MLDVGGTHSVCSKTRAAVILLLPSARAELHCANSLLRRRARFLNCVAVIAPEIGVTFVAALTATLKIFLMGAAGYFVVWRGLLPPAGVAGLASLVANLALPCLIVQQFAIQFDPAQFPNWWVVALAGMALQLAQIGLGWALSRRLKPEQGRDEMTMLLGFQNSGFFVLPMLQGLLVGAEFNRAAIYMFVFVIFFNGSLWPAGNRIMLKTSAFDWKTILLTPPTLWTLISLVVFGIFHRQSLLIRDNWLWHSLIGDAQTGVAGALQLVGGTTIPLATIVLGAAVAQTVRAGNFANPRLAAEVAFWKLMAWPLVGLALIKFWPGPLFDDHVLRLLIMLEFSVPPATAIVVFCQQNNYPMKLMPAASLACYALCVVTIPFWVALVL